MFKFPNDIVNKFHIIFFILILFSFTTFAQQLAQDKSHVEKERAAAHAMKYDISNIIPLYEDLYEKFL